MYLTATLYNIMSYHAPINAEAEARYRAQRRSSTIASLIIGLLIIALLGLIFWAIAIPYFVKKTEPIIAYSTPNTSDEVVEKKKIVNNVVKKPSQSSSSSAVKVMTAATSTSSFSITTPEVATDNMSLDFGTSDGFGQGWGSGAGFGAGGAGSFSFMGSKMSGERICFVIDYSMSMKGTKIRLLKEELTKTLEQLPKGLQFELVFFAGPAWLAGSEVADLGARSSSTITFEKKEYVWRASSVHDWLHVDERQQPKWEIINESSRALNLTAIAETGLVWGTDWKNPLDMALTMKPQPDLIVFLTDGASGTNSMDIAEDVGEKAKKDGIKINTIALMEPAARDAMSRLAEITGGEFALIDKDGNKVNQDNSANPKTKTK